MGLFGPIFDETAPIILSKLARHVIGQDALAYNVFYGGCVVCYGLQNGGMPSGQL
jgi:hypothetical protein